MNRLALPQLVIPGENGAPITHNFRVLQIWANRLTANPPSVAAVATDAATTQTLANDLRAKMITLGFVK